ncbi:MAG: hypothetical protein FWH19_01005 [Treponema sp.]|nr:hypothetical protein [Treponema sp.]
MKKKLMAVMAALMIFAAFPVSASMVSILLVETGLNDAVPSNQYASLWEGGLMEAFFNAGHIVTNSPVARLIQKPERDLSGFIEIDFIDAVEGGADFFILAYLQFQDPTRATPPGGVCVKIYSTATKELVYEETFTAGRQNLTEEYQHAQDVGRIVLSHIRK